VVLGQVTEKFRAAVKAQAEQQQIPVYQFTHKEQKDDIAKDFRRQRGVREQIVFIGVAQEKAQTFNGKKVNGRFEFNRDKAVYVNHYCRRMRLRGKNGRSRSDHVLGDGWHRCTDALLGSRQPGC
jgi:hypothetical protein